MLLKHKARPASRPGPFFVALLQTGSDSPLMNSNSAPETARPAPAAPSRGRWAVTAGLTANQFFPDEKGARRPFAGPAPVRSLHSLSFLWRLFVYRRDARQPRLTFFFGGLFNSRGNSPDVPCGIHDPADTVAPELVLHWKKNFCSA